ncbi:putative Abhydrolase domain-containing protein, partial [Naja naja]
MRLVCWDSS